MSSLSAISTLSQYLQRHGKHLTRKAIKALTPLHTPGKDPLPDFDDYPEDRMPMEAQQHVAAATIKCLDKHGSEFLIGEPGVGKTITAIAAIHEHAKRPRRQGGRNGRYRAIVICPDTLIAKWKREIESTLPEAHVITIKSWKDILRCIGDGKTTRKSTKVGEKDYVSDVSQCESPAALKASVKRKAPWADLVTTVEVGGKSDSVVHQERLHWKQGWDAEWLVLGRDQIKRCATFTGLNGKELAMKRIVETDRVEVYDDAGKPVYTSGYKRKTKGVYAKRHFCPRCGKIPTEKGQPISMEELAKKQTNCTGIMLRELAKDGAGNDVLYESQDYRKYKGVNEEGFPAHARRMKPGSKIQHAGKSWVIEECKEPLYQYIRKPNWWPAARIIQKKMRRWAQYLVVDEAHEQKGADTDQADAMGKVLAGTRYCMAMTGTFIGGYAHHLFPLLIRMAGSEMKARGFQWGDRKPFTEKYGCVDRITRGTTAVQASGRLAGSRGMKKTKIGPVTESTKERPGIMPTLFSQLIMHRSIFLKLDQFIDELPGFDEQLIAVNLPPEIQASYDKAARTLQDACAEMISQGNMKLLGTMLWTLLAYPDYPFDFFPQFPEAAQAEKRHAIGWWKQSKVYTEDNFVGVCSPENFTQDIVLPKEQAIIDWSKELANKNEQHWIYTLLKHKHSPVSRIQSLLEKEGLRVGVLDSKDASPREREDYINKVGRNVDVMISHPQLVATGLDLFNFTSGKHNFNNLSFFQTGYNLFTIRQASRRGYRIGQPLDCTVRYFYYANTMQASGMDIMSRKAAASQRLEEGTVSEEGLAAMGGGSDQLALVNAISNAVDPADIQRNWGRVKSGQRSEKKRKAIVSVPRKVEDDAAWMDEEDDGQKLVPVIEPEDFDEPTVTISEEDLDFDEDDLQEMFANLGKGGGDDEMDW